jgi:hypothetical protein
MGKKFPPHIFLEQQFELRMPNGQPLDIPIGGAIGLLALGDVGTIAWRQKILAVKTELAQRTQTDHEQNKGINSSDDKHESHE